MVMDADLSLLSISQGRMVDVMAMLSLDRRSRVGAGREVQVLVGIRQDVCV